jgi:hypothetical protein
MIWERRGDHAIACAEYIIGKYIVGGDPVYVLWHNTDRLSQHPSSGEAREAAHQHHNSPRPCVKGK